jgi:aminobenzoyl-glutamate utilization protein B
MNAEIMEDFREEMQKYYYDSDSYDSYLDQLGVSYPTLRQPDGRCTIGSFSEQGN